MIYLDVSTAVHSRAGLGRYAARLAEAIADQRPGQIKLFHNQSGSGKMPPSLQSLAASEVNLGFKPWRMAVLLAHLSRIGFNRLVPDAHLFHSTEHLLMPLTGIPTILTVHDLIFKLFPAYHKPLNYWYLNLAMPIYCQRATAIITISEASKRDIVSHYQVDPAKIHVIYEAAAAHFRPATEAHIARVRQHYNLPQRYLIHLGTIEPRKNIGRLLDALLILRRSHPDLELVLVGTKGWLVDDLMNKIETDALAHIVHPLGWIDDDDLTAIISGAVLAVQPSLYEGFGLPVLEHMACGQVVAVSDRSSLPEIGGDAAAYFNPEDTEEIAAVIDRLLTSPDERQWRREAGFNRSNRFSWARTATETLALYDQFL